MIRILTDSSSGFTLEEVKKYNIEMMYIPINFDGTEYLDQKELTTDEFYAKLTTSKNLPKTSAINQILFEEVFNEAKEKGDELIVLTIAKELSITFEQAVRAKDAVGYDKIHLIDTSAVAPALIALVLETVRLRNENKTAKDIVLEIEKLVPRVKLYAYVDTLKYLRAGGRISGASAMIGTMLSIKPHLYMINGKLESYAKSRGLKKAQAHLLAQLKEQPVDFSMPIYFGHTNNIAECEKLKQEAIAEHKFADTGNWAISATVATHAGPGAVAVVFFTKK